MLGLNDATKNIPHGIWIDCNVPCGVYGPLFPLPSKFGYFPQYCVDAKIDENVHSITSSNESSISISDHNTKAGAGLKYKNESNEMIRRYYSDDNSSDNTIRKTSINPMIILIGAGTGITPFFKVIHLVVVAQPIHLHVGSVRIIILLFGGTSLMISYTGAKMRARRH